MNILDYPFDPAMILQKKRSLRRELSKKEGLIPKNIAIMSGSTIGEIKNILELFLLANGIRPTFMRAAIPCSTKTWSSTTAVWPPSQPDIIYIHTSWRNLKNLPTQADSPEACADKLHAECARFEQAWKAAARFGCPVIQNNFDLPPYRVMGNLDAVDVHGRVRFVRRA